MSGPLAGVRIVEMACIGSGPFAGMLLADFGFSGPDIAGLRDSGAVTQA